VTAPADPLPSRARLVAATLATLDEHGYSTLRVVDVARRAGLTTGAIYGSFRTKHTLVAAALHDRHPAALAAAVDAAAAGAGHADVLAAALDVLDARGYTKLQLSDVARLAGTTVADLRPAFPTRHHLIAAAVVATAPDRYVEAVAELTHDDAGPAASAGVDSTTRDRLLAAALDVLDTAGYRGARIADIARRAGVTTGAVYKNFDSKDQLLDAAMAQRYGNLFRAALGHAAAGPGGLLAVVTAALDQASSVEHRALIELFAVASRDRDAGAPLVQELDRRHREIADLVDESKADGQIPPEVPSDGLADILQLLAVGNIVVHGIGARHATPHEIEATLRHLTGAFGSARPPDGSDG
jgi:AcrR family transcriptional regulator